MNTGHGDSDFQSEPNIVDALVDPQAKIAVIGRMEEPRGVAGNLALFAQTRKEGVQHSAGGQSKKVCRPGPPVEYDHAVFEEADGYRLAGKGTTDENLYTGTGTGERR